MGQIQGIKSIMHFLESTSDLEKITLSTLSSRLGTDAEKEIIERKKNTVEIYDLHKRQIRFLLIYEVCLNITLG